MVSLIIYKTFSRFLCALTLALLWNRAVNTLGLRSIRFAYGVFGLCFFALAWVNYLRLDGINIPPVNWLPFSTRKRSFGSFCDIPDHLDEEVASFDGLADGERHICYLLANVICGIAFLFLSLM